MYPRVTLIDDLIIKIRSEGHVRYTAREHADPCNGKQSSHTSLSLRMCLVTPCDRHSRMTSVGDHVWVAVAGGAQFAGRHCAIR